MEEAKQKYEELMQKKSELQNTVKNTRATVNKLRKDVQSLSTEVNKRYLIKRCTSVEEGQEVPPIPDSEALRILKDLEKNPSLLDEVIVALVQRKAALTHTLSNLQEHLQKVSDESEENTTG